MLLEVMIDPARFTFQVQAYLWQAVNHEGELLESFVTKTRNKPAAFSFIKRALKNYRQPQIILTMALPFLPFLGCFRGLFGI